MERAAHFYETVFGFARGFGATLQGEWIETVTGLEGARAQCLFLEPPRAAATGATRIELIRYDAPIANDAPLDAAPNARGLRHIAFEVQDLDATLDKIRALGITPISAPVEVPFRVADLGVKRLAYFHDFDGTIVEVAAYQK